MIHFLCSRMNDFFRKKFKFLPVKTMVCASCYHNKQATTTFSCKTSGQLHAQGVRSVRSHCCINDHSFQLVLTPYPCFLVSLIAVSTSFFDILFFLLLLQLLAFLNESFQLKKIIYYSRVNMIQ